MCNLWNFRSVLSSNKKIVLSFIWKAEPEGPKALRVWISVNILFHDPPENKYILFIKYYSQLLNVFKRKKKKGLFFMHFCFNEGTSLEIANENENVHLLTFS